MKKLPAIILEKLEEVLGQGEFYLHEPTLFGNEKKYLSDCIDSNFVSSAGQYVEKFEKDLADYVGAKRAVAVVNGTSALQVALKLVGVQTNDEVITPALSFIATANASKYLGAIPHFVDINENTMGLDPIALREWLASISEHTEDGLETV